MVFCFSEYGFLGLGFYDDVCVKGFDFGIFGLLIVYKRLSLVVISGLLYVYLFGLVCS